VATFTFDAEGQTVWLDEPRDGAASAGELCERHAHLLTPPRGWRLDDRRGGTEAAMESAVEAIPERRAEPVGEIPVEVPVAIPAAIPVAAGAPEAEDVEDPIPALRILLDAHTPLLARAFESAGTV
jgi:hypothetical protein